MTPFLEPEQIVAVALPLLVAAVFLDKCWSLVPVLCAAVGDVLPGARQCAGNISPGGKQDPPVGLVPLQLSEPRISQKGDPEMCSGVKKKLVMVLVACGALTCFMAGSAMAVDVNAIEVGGTGTYTLDGGSGTAPVVTNILSQPGTVNGKTYTSWSFLVQDQSGSSDIYGTLAGLGYTPTVGDAINATGTYSPYHQIPELGTLTAISCVSSGNSVPVPASSRFRLSMCRPSPLAWPGTCSNSMM